MSGSSMARFGGTCATLIGYSYIILGANYLLMPAEQRMAGSAKLAFMRSVAESPAFLQIQAISLGLQGLLALAVILALADLLRSEQNALLRWASAVGALGFAVLAVNQFRQLAVYPARAVTYLQADEAVRAAMAQSGVSLDPDGWMQFGATGLWIAVVCYVALQGGRVMTRPHAILGLMAAAAHFLVVAGLVSQERSLFTVAAILGGAAGAVWYVWLGSKLRHGIGAAEQKAA
jgi:hypothetical protein